MDRQQTHLPTLSILFWNAAGLDNKISEFRAYMEGTGPDIALIQETKFTDRYRYNIANYKLYRNDRQHIPRRKPEGGTAIYIKSCINHYVVNDLVTDDLESNSIMVLPDSSNKILVTSAYVRHRRGFPDSDFSKIFSYTDHCIVAGDLNAHNTAWNCKRTNLFGRELLNLVTNNPDINLYHPSSPTHYSTGYPSTIDLALIKNIPFNSNIETLDLFDSDHLPVLLTVDLTVRIQLSDPTIYTNWQQFQDTLAYSKLFYPVINSKTHIDRAVSKFTDLINWAVQKSSHSVNKPKIYQLPRRIKSLINKRNTARKLFQFFRSPTLRQEYYSIKRTVKEEIQKFKQEQWSDFIGGLTAEDNTLWKFQKRLRSNGGTNFPPIHGNNGVAFDTFDKAEAIANTYEQQFSPNQDLEDVEHDNLVTQTVNNFLSIPPNSSLPPANITELRDIIKNLKDSKAPGIDKISNKCIRNLPPNLLIYLTALINAILKFNYFPKSWKIAIVCPIPKPGANLTFPESYRPISLLSCLSKVTERFIYNRLNSFLNTNNILIPEQFGFRSQHSTTHQLLRVVEFASEGLNKKKPTGALFLDVAKAFDRITHIGLIYKLIKLEMQDALIHLIHNYLCDRQFTVRIHNIFSTHKPITAGVQQGSILGPTLFNIYVNDIPRNSLTNIAMYADDTALYTAAHHINSVATYIQSHINDLEIWFTKWKIKINTQKCHAIYFSKSYKNPPRLYMFDEVIEWENSVKYLGVTLDRKLTWRPHISNVKNTLNTKVGMLRTLLFNKKLNIQNKLLLYKSIILPTALYAAPIWAFAAKTNIQQIETFQNKMLRRLTNSNRYVTNEIIRRTVNIPTFLAQAKKLAINFYHQTSNLPNEIIAELPDYDFRLPKNRKRPRAVLGL